LLQNNLNVASALHFQVSLVGGISMALKSMSIEKLAALRDQVEAALSSKVLEQRRALESSLSKLGRFQGGKSSKGARGYGAVAPKYRNPENPAETWAGRGLKPRWLTAAIKSGKKIDDFLIAGSAALKANGRKTAKGAIAKAVRAKAAACPICEFQTTPPHDGRTHRNQKKKAPFSAEELKERGLAKV
jgi:DNA-binding protein H-NS